jgi:hypothetical protein
MSGLARELVWASAYAADFARQFADCWAAAPSTEWRNEGLGAVMVPLDRTGPAIAGVDVRRCKAVADAAVEAMGEVNLPLSIAALGSPA